MFAKASIQSVAVILFSATAEASDGYCLINLSGKPDWQALGAVGSFVAAAVAVLVAIGIEQLRRREKYRFQSQCKVRLAAEAAGIAKQTVRAFELLKIASGPMPDYIMPPMVRPVAEAITPRMFDMDDATVVAAAMYEGHLREALKKASDLNKGGNKKKLELQAALADILIISATYTKKLFGDKSNGLAGFVTKTMKVEVPDDMSKLIDPLLWDGE